MTLASRQICLDFLRMWEVLQGLKLMDLPIRKLFPTFHWVKRFRLLLQIDIISTYMTVAFMDPSQVRTYHYVQLCAQLYQIELDIRRFFQSVKSLKRYGL